LISISIYFKCKLFLWWSFSFITPVFSVTWSFWNHLVIKKHFFFLVSLFFFCGKWDTF